MLHMGMLHKDQYPFSRSYGVILPSSLTKILPRVLGYSPRLPVSVCGTGNILLDSNFSRQYGINHFSTYFSIPITPRDNVGTDLPIPTLYMLGPTLSIVGLIYPPASLLLSNAIHRYRNYHLLSIAYAFRPLLRSRLTLSGRAFLRKP